MLFNKIKCAVSLFVLVCGSDAFAVIMLPDLAAGSQYRLVFTTNGKRDSTSLNIADYNAFVTNQANMNPEFAALGTTWTAICSTPTVNARDNTNTVPSLDPMNPSGVPIFILFNGILPIQADKINKVVDNYNDLWDGTLDKTLPFDQFLENHFSQVGTGTAIDGIGIPGLELGQSSIAIGINIDPESGWLFRGTGEANRQVGFYGLSGILVAGTIPEPNSFLTFALLSTGLVSRKFRNRSRVELRF